MKVYVGNLYKGFVEVKCVGERIIDAKEGCPLGDEMRKQSLRRWKKNFASIRNGVETIYHRRPIDCMALAGDTDCGGLFDMLIPVVGLTIGMAFRTRG